MQGSSDVGVNLNDELPTQPAAPAKNKKLAISPREAKKILGKDICEKFNDADLRKIIIALEQVCRLLVLNLKNLNNERNNNGQEN